MSALLNWIFWILLLQRSSLVVGMEEVCSDGVGGRYPVGVRFVMVMENKCYVYACKSQENADLEETMCFSVDPDACIDPGSPQIFRCRDEKGTLYHQCRCKKEGNKGVAEILSVAE